MDWRRVRTLGWGMGLWFLLTAATAARGEITIRGKATASDGGTLAEARVRLFAVTDAHDAALAQLAGEAPLPVAEVRPAADGRFEIIAPEAGMWRVEAEARDRLPMAIALVPLTEERTLPVVELEPAETLDIRVLGPDGEPAADVWVRAVGTTDVPRFAARFLRGLGSGWAPAERLERSDEDGRVTLARSADEKLTLRAGGADRLESEELETRTGTATLRLDAGGTVSVRAVDSRGKPLAGVLALNGEGRWPRAADDAGRIELNVPTKGKLDLSLSDADGRHYVGSVASGAAGRPEQTLDLVLEEPRRLPGRVLDKQSRRPVAGALVWIASAPSEFARTDGRGVFALTVKRPGDVWLQAGQSGYQLGNLQVVERSPHEPVVALAPAARVRGVVVDASGRPVAEAEIGVKLGDPGGRRFVFSFGDEEGAALARSGEDGRFVLSGVEPGAGYSAYARHRDFAQGETPLPELEPLATTVNVRIVLDTGSRLTGRVIDQGGAPVAGAELRLETAVGGASRMFRMMRREMGTKAPEAWSDNDGGFQFVRLAAGSFDLVVSAGGFATTTVPGVEVKKDAGGADTGAIVLAPGVELAGRVLDADGRPLEGAEVWAQPANPMNAMRMRFGAMESDPDARAAADGHFALGDRLPGERVDLLVRHPGYSAGSLSGVEVPPVAPVEVVLRPASSLSGKVFDARDEPVPQARVQAFAEGGGATSGGSVFMMSVAGMAASDQEGEFTIEDIEPGTIRLSVSAPGFRETEISNIEVPTGEDVEGLEIELLEGASVRGSVRASDGRPMAGARVYVVERQRRMGRGGGFGAETDGDGNYFLQGVEPGNRLIGARHEESEVTRELKVEEGENTLDLTFEGGVEVAGRVLDQTGTPLAGAVVMMSSPNRAMGGGSSTRTSADGSFTFTGIRDGTYQVSALKEGFAQSQEGTEVEVAGAPLYGLEVRLGPGGAITGQIRGLEPGQLLAVDIWASSAGRDFLTGEVRHDGTYRVRDVGAGTWTVSARTSDGSGQARGRVTVEPGQPEALLDLEFGGGLRVTGRVLQGAEPVAGISVGITGIDVRSNANGVTGRDGRFSIEGVEPGRHRVEVMDFSSGIQHSEEHEIRSDHDLVIELAVSRVSGRVVDSTDSSPIAGAVVRLEPLGDVEDSRRYFQRGGSTDAGGVFNVHNVAAGGYRLLAEKDGYSPGERTLQIEADRFVEDLELRLQPTDGLGLRVFLPSGRPASQVWVAVLDGAGRTIVSGDYPVDQEGRLRLPTVPAGSWRLLVGTSGTAVANVRAVAPGDAGDVRLIPEARLQVRIAELAEDATILTIEAIGADGQPTVSLRWRGHVERHWRGSYGRATLGGLAPGPWLIRATAPDGRVWSKETTLSVGENPRLDLD